jgi:putative glycosyltransferase (TIGR04372 family)
VTAPSTCQQFVMNVKSFVYRHEGLAALRLLKKAVNAYFVLRDRLAPTAGRLRSTLFVDLLRLNHEPSIRCKMRGLAQEMSAAVNAPSATFDSRRVADIKARIDALYARLDPERMTSSEPVEIRCWANMEIGDRDGWLRDSIASFVLQERRIKEKGLDKLGIRLIPPGPFIRTIGNASVIENFIRGSLLGLRDNPRYVLPLHPEFKKQYAVNPAFLEYWSKYIDIVEDRNELNKIKLLDPDLYINFFSVDVDGEVIGFSHAALARLQTEWDERGLPPLFSLRPDHEASGRETLRELGLGPDDWYVCFHVRSGGFKGEDEFRDSPIEDYFEAMRAITDLGGWVFRMGDPSMAPMPEMPRVIDYAHSNIKSDWMDVFLCATSRFFVGTSSGLHHVANPFGTPIVATNYLPICAAYFGPQDLFMPKRLFDKRTGEDIPLGRLLGQDYSYAMSNGLIRNVMGLGWHNNTPEELREAVLEMYHRLNGTQTYSAEEERRQQEIKALTARDRIFVATENQPLRCRVGNHFLSRSTI